MQIDFRKTSRDLNKAERRSLLLAERRRLKKTTETITGLIIEMEKNCPVCKRAKVISKKITGNERYNCEVCRLVNDGAISKRCNTFEVSTKILKATLEFIRNEFKELTYDTEDEIEDMRGP